MADVAFAPAYPRFHVDHGVARRDRPARADHRDQRVRLHHRHQRHTEVGVLGHGRRVVRGPGAADQSSAASRLTPVESGAGSVSPNAPGTVVRGEWSVLVMPILAD